MKNKISPNIVFLLCLLILTISFSEAFSNNFWLRQNTGTTKSFYKLAYSDSLHMWAAGDSGIIVHTSNGGNTWDIQNSGIPYFIYDINFINANTGWAVAIDIDNFTGCFILSTTNAGNNWNVAPYPVPSQFFLTINFLDSLNGFMAGIEGSIVRTSNGGINWALVPSDSSAFGTHNITSLTFYNRMFAYASGGRQDIAGIIWRTTNGGMFWKAYGIATEPLLDVHFFDSLNAIASGGDYKYGANIVNTTNGGETWVYRQLKMFGAGESITFRTRSEGWISLGFTQKLALTLDSGRTWTELSSPDNSVIRQMKFIDSVRGWAAGSGGVIYKFYGKTVGINNNTGLIPSLPSLYQNYPNPFNPYTTIKFYLLKPGRVKITLYNSVGEKLKVLLNDGFSSGEHFINFDGNGYPSGVYFYTLEAGGITQTKKMLLVK